MKKQIILTIIKMGAEALLITLFVAIVIGIIGYRNQWDTSLKYSNAFFIAGCLVIIAGTISRLGAGQEWSNFRGVYAESFRDMSPSERANFIVEASSSARLVILGLSSGILLILIAVLLTEFF